MTDSQKLHLCIRPVRSLTFRYIVQSVKKNMVTILAVTPFYLRSDLFIYPFLNANEIPAYIIACACYLTEYWIYF